MTRREADFYPTTPECVEALRLWLVERRGELIQSTPRLRGGLPVFFYEPAAGYGAIVRGLQVDDFTIPAQWVATELQARLAERLHPHCDQVWTGNALERHRHHRFAVPPRISIVVANPPFSHLDEFVSMALDYVERGAWAIVLTRGQWLDEPGQAELRRRRRPSHQLRMCWRPQFNGTGTPSATHCWNVWSPHDNGSSYTELHFLERPTLDARHRELVAAHHQFQPGAVQEGLGL